MIPIALDPSKVRIGLVGRGVLTHRRWMWLQACGATPAVFSDEPDPDVAVIPALIGRLPNTEDLAALDVVWIADLPLSIAGPLADEAQRHRLLVNVEDELNHCQFHTPAIVRRGALTVAISTGGASPAAAGSVRALIDQALAPEWSQVLDEVAAARAALKAAGASGADVTADARARLIAAGLVKEKR